MLFSLSTVYLILARNRSNTTPLEYIRVSNLRKPRSNQNIMHSMGEKRKLQFKMNTEVNLILT